MARFFIDRPVFAMVVAIVIVLLGIAALPSLPIANYPEVIPPVVQISTNYLGGNAQDLEKTVAQPIEEQLFGLDGLLYFLCNSSNDGTLNFQVTFRLGTNPDTAVVQTQNRVNIAMPRLPQEVQRQGVTVKKVSSAFLTSVALISPDNRYDSLFLNNYVQINLLNRIANLDGVGECRLSVNQIYSMRIWVNPDRMAELGITASDVSSAIQAQNRQNPAGNFGQPPTPLKTAFQYSVSAPGRLVDPSQFEDVILRARPDTSQLHIHDIGRVQLGAQNYSGFSRVNGKTAGNLIVYLSPGANAVDTANRIRKFMEEAKKSFPEGMEYVIPYDSTVFVHAAIREVLITLLEAIGLVILVVFIFLQNWRATLIPLLTVPVSIIGTFALFPALGFSINLTSMFGLVLAIGIVVDDAIVVVEAVQRHIDEGLTPRDATIQAMREVSAPVVAIACILAAVFIPVAFLGGISGLIYKQFALTIAISVLISAFSALSLSPALSALILRPKTQSHALLARFFSGFNIGFDWLRNRYLAGVHSLIRKSALALLGLLLFWLAAGTLFHKLPNGFLPDEDQGTILASIRLPDGASVARANAATKKIEAIVARHPAVEGTLTMGGADFTTRTNSSNVATLVIRLKPWDDRSSTKLQLQSVIADLQTEFAKVPEATVFAFGSPPIQGLSSTGGFQFMLEDRIGGSLKDFSQVADNLMQAAQKRPELTNMRNTFRSNVPGYRVDVDLAKVQILGIPVTGAYDALQTFLGGLYINDFNTFGRSWQVVVQAQPEFRSQPADINHFYVRNNDGNMVPLGTISTVKATAGPDVMYRYNRYPAIQLTGAPAPGYSSGQATKAMEEVAASALPSGYSYEWTGTTYQEKEAQGHEGLIFGFAAILVFLSLAALYESWAIPFAVLMALPLGFFGALFAVWLRAYPYDIYTQIGIVTLIGLAAKNAILIVEFARMKHGEGKSIHDAAMEAARLRLRPILMTSFAFILGVTPLLIARGAGGASRRSLGTAVFGGMNAATLLAIFIVPVLYSAIQRVAESKRKPISNHEAATELSE
jgi:hydrophobe/amphiphile efflux-1 (HAE1) family protein